MRIKFSSAITERASKSVFGPRLDKPHEALAGERRDEAVRAAVAALPSFEQLIIRQYYFEGASVAQIAGGLGVGRQEVINSHNRALRRLRKALMALVEAEFGVPKQQTACAICSSPHRREIDLILAEHLRGEPYREIIREIKKRFNVTIVSAMTIVGHRKYHS